jgi:serine/threonine-protein kinase HipA
VPPARRPRRPGLDVWMNGDRVGRWTRSASQEHRFAYDAGWLQAAHTRPLSLSLPLAAGTRPFQGEAVHAFFDNLLPESPALRQRWRTRFRVEGSDAFDLLSAVGRDCVGAVHLMPAGNEPPSHDRIDAEPLTVDQVARLLARSGDEGAATADDEPRFALPGVQDKLALLWHQGQWHRPLGATPSTHILKLPLGSREPRQAALSTSLENEWLCAQILQAYGLPVADCRIEQFLEFKALVVERFDRRLVRATWWARLPQEDLCQATAQPSERKAEADGGPGLERVLNLLRGADAPATDRDNFLATQLVFWMLAAPGGHGKNFSLLLREGGRFALAPCYDVMSAWPIAGDVLRERLRMAMAVGPAQHAIWKDITRADWNATARRAAMGPDFEPMIGRILEATPGVIEGVSAALPEGFPGSVVKRIFEGLRESAGRLAGMGVR